MIPLFDRDQFLYSVLATEAYYQSRPFLALYIYNVRRRSWKDTPAIGDWLWDVTACVESLVCMYSTLFLLPARLGEGR